MRLSRRRKSSITTKFQGKTYSANYSVISGVVNVASVHGSRSITVGRSKAEITARWLHLEILEDAKPRGEISAVLVQSNPLESRSDFIPATRKEARRSFYGWKKPTGRAENHDPKVKAELEELNLRLADKLKGQRRRVNPV
jgi:hypothetical protein